MECTVGFALSSWILYIPSIVFAPLAKATIDQISETNWYQDHQSLPFILFVIPTMLLYFMEAPLFHLMLRTLPLIWSDSGSAQSCRTHIRFLN